MVMFEVTADYEDSQPAFKTSEVAKSKPYVPPPKEEKKAQNWELPIDEDFDVEDDFEDEYEEPPKKESMLPEISHSRTGKIQEQMSQPTTSKKNTIHKDDKISDEEFYKPSVISKPSQMMSYDEPKKIVPPSQAIESSQYDLEMTYGGDDQEPAKGKIETIQQSIDEDEEQFENRY